MTYERLIVSKHRFFQQVGRARRYLQRMKAATEGKQPPNEDSAHNYDDFYSFFIHCYHIKDWLKADPTFTVHASGQEIEEFVERTVCLKICGDICNGMKHLGPFPPAERGQRKRNTAPRFPDVALRRYQLAVGDPAPKLSMKFMVGRKTYDAVAFGQECMDEWERFIDERLNANKHLR